MLFVSLTWFYTIYIYNYIGLKQTVGSKYQCIQSLSDICLTIIWMYALCIKLLKADTTFTLLHPHHSQVPFPWENYPFSIISKCHLDYSFVSELSFPTRPLYVGCIVFKYMTRPDGKRGDRVNCKPQT